MAWDSSGSSSSSSSDSDYFEGINKESFVNKYIPPFCDDVLKYDVLQKIGEGSYGQVFKVLYYGNFYALKKIPLDDMDEEGFPATAIREIQILRQLDHINVVTLNEMCYLKGSENPKFLPTFFMVLEYCEHDLAGILMNREVKFTEGEIKTIIQQLFTGLHFVHSKNIIHRDLKPSNILMTQQGLLKLADFNLARVLESDDERYRYSTNVVSLWYRPPEILLGDACYGRSADVWSAGCIAAELWTRRAVMQGSCVISQIARISALCGSINPKVWPGVARLPGYTRLAMPTGLKRRVKSLIKSFAIDTTAYDLVDNILVLDPSKRLDCNNVLKHEFFSHRPLPEDLGSLMSQFSESMYYCLPPKKTRQRATSAPPNIPSSSKNFD